MYYPSFYCFQVINHFSDRPLLETRDLYISAISYKSGENDWCVAGDSEGTIHIINQTNPDHENSEYRICNSIMGKHRITLIQVLIVYSLLLSLKIALKRELDVHHLIRSKNSWF
jgi:hypothetical protein